MGPLCPISIYGSPVALLKFQLASKIILLMSCSSKKKEARYTCLSEAKASHSHGMWAKVSSSAPHLQSGLFDSPIRWTYLLRVLCPMRMPETALDCVLLKDKKSSLGIQTGSRNEVTSLSLGVTKTSSPYPMLVNQPTYNPSSYILPRDSQGQLRSSKLQSRAIPCQLAGNLISL